MKTRYEISRMPFPRGALASRRRDAGAPRSHLRYHLPSILFGCGFAAPRESVHLRLISSRGFDFAALFL